MATLSILFHTFFLLLLLVGGGVVKLNESEAGESTGCSEAVELVMMESESTRRIAAETRRKYISPGALKRDQPVCNGGAAGDPYSRGGGCLPQPSNPYNRGCQRYYRCRGDA